MIKIIQEKTGKPATRTSTAALEAFQELKITRVNVVNPYEDCFHEK